MGVSIPIPITRVEAEREQPSLTYKLDLDNGRILRAGSCDGLDAVNQHIRKALLTPRFRCLIYDNQYGSELKETIIASDVTREYIETEAPRLIRDAVLADSRVTDIKSISFEFSGETAHIRFVADTVFGETVVEEVM